MSDAMRAYSIDRAEAGWRWRVFDLEGELVAMGVEPTQEMAESRAHDASRPPPADGRKVA